LQNRPRWILIEPNEPEKSKYILRAADLAHQLQSREKEEGSEQDEKAEKRVKKEGNDTAKDANEQNIAPKTKEDADNEHAQTIDLSEVPGQRLQLSPIHDRANLYEAHKLMKQSKTDAVYVERGRPIRGSTVMGLITRDTIENYYSP